MIKENNSIINERLLSSYLNYKFKKTFSHFYLTSSIPIIKDKAILITPNHFSWWDGFFIYKLNRMFLNKRFKVLMLEEQLKKYPFFIKIGAFSINQTSLKEIKDSINHCKEILEDPDNLLLFYPQGKFQYPFEEIKIKEGIFKLIKESNASVIIASFNIYYEENEKPFIAGRFEEVIFTNEDDYKCRFIQSINRLNDDVLNKKYITDII